MNKPNLRVAQVVEIKSIDMADAIRAICEQATKQEPASFMAVWELRTDGSTECNPLIVCSAPDSFSLRKGFVDELFKRYFPPEIE